jgi:hypothetical protein
METTETLAEILTLLRKIDAELGAIKEISTLRDFRASYEAYCAQEARAMEKDDAAA